MLKTKKPQKGFYYHYKHDPKGTLNNYAYEVLGAGHHTEESCRPEDEFMVVYRPLYKEARVYKEGKLFDLRPLSMFLQKVAQKTSPTGRPLPRFRKITDPKIIKKLSALRREMYE